MSGDDFGRTGVDPVSRCLLGCGAAVAAQGQDEHRRWHGQQRLQALQVQALRASHGRVERLLADQSDIATIDMP